MLCCFKSNEIATLCARLASAVEEKESLQRRLDASVAEHKSAIEAIDRRADTAMNAANIRAAVAENAVERSPYDAAMWAAHMRNTATAAPAYEAQRLSMILNATAVASGTSNLTFAQAPAAPTPISFASVLPGAYRGASWNSTASGTSLPTVCPEQ